MDAPAPSDLVFCLLNEASKLALEGFYQALNLCNGEITGEGGRES